ncbi:MAG: pyridoxal-phosphate dependent enzyme, partial [Actinomycetota bacterium]|nr:pyridoxal-phosphate dependent enzyme [Actinomycetota bacterium]
RAVTELDGPPPARIMVAAGSGGTAAGLVAGIAARGWPTRVVAAAVSRPAGATEAVITELAGQCSARLGLPAAGGRALDVVDAIGAGFHVSDAADRAAADLALDTEGLLVDPTYTAKALAALMDLAGRGDAGGATVFWHTGGVGGALREQEAR